MESLGLISENVKIQNPELKEEALKKSEMKNFWNSNCISRKKC